MKILYGLQATGNGPISRAIELVPEPKEYAEVDVLMSGTENSLKFPYDVK